MANAVLKIAIEGGADARRAFGAIVGESRRANAAISADSRRASREQTAASQTAARSQIRDLNNLSREEQKLARIREQAAAKATKAAEAEAKKRTAAASAEERELERSANAIVKARESAERRVTAEVAKQQRARTQAARAAAREEQQIFRDVARAEAAEARDGARNAARARRRADGRVDAFISGAGAVAGYGSAVMSGAMDRTMDVRARRASADHTMNGAFYQAGAGGEDMTRMRARMHQFAASRGMNIDELAGAANAAQTEFSVFGDSRSTQADREQNMTQFLSNAEFARNTYQDVGQVARVSGLLGQAGIQGPAQHQALLAMTGMAQRGAIELGDVSRTAMAPMERRMSLAANRARAAGGSETDVTHAQQQAVMETMAEMEVGRGLGLTPRALGNVTSNLEGRLSGGATQALLLSNLQHAGTPQSQAAIASMFTNGHLNAQFQSTMGLAHGLNAAGINSTDAQNMLAGSGHGNAQSLRANERQVLGAMMGSEGAVSRMVAGAGTDFTEADVNRGKDAVDHEARTALQSQQEQSDNLMANSDSLNALTTELQTFRAANPILAEAASHLPGGQTTEAAVAIVANGGTAQGRDQFSIARQAMGVRSNNDVLEQVERYRTSHNLGNDTLGQNAAMEGAITSTNHGIGSKATATKGGGNGGPVNVTVNVSLDAHSAAHVANEGRSGATPPPPESRNGR